MLFQLGGKGPEVRKIQQRLTDLGYKPGSIDGIYGVKTEAAIILFQKDNKVPGGADGISGPYTLQALSLWAEMEQPTPPTPPDNPHAADDWYFPPPKRRSNWAKLYGQPTGRKSWEDAYLGFCDLSDLKDPREMTVSTINKFRAACGLGPVDYEQSVVQVFGVDHLYYPLPGGRKLQYFATRYNPAGGRGYGFVIHKKCEKVYHEFFRRLVVCDLLKHLRTFNGSYVFRQVRGGRSLSPHSYGMAIDLDAQWNGMGNHSYEMHPDILALARNMGFTVGADFNRVDAMHFQWGSY